MRRSVLAGFVLATVSAVGGCALLVGDFELAGSGGSAVSTTSAGTGMGGATSAGGTMSSSGDSSSGSGICDGSSSGGACMGGPACAPGSICSASGCSDWPSWPIPNTSAGLPHQASYTKLSGYVLDNVTGLWWQQPIDEDNDLGTNCAGGCTQANAIKYCANLELAGHCDWRLPTRIELVSIVDYSLNVPTINAIFEGTPAVGFWTSSPYHPSASFAWLVLFLDGSTGLDAPSNANRVRCVR